MPAAYLAGSLLVLVYVTRPRWLFCIMGLLLVACGQNSAQGGQHIFETGIDANDSPIPYSGGMPMRTACANCHGEDGHGAAMPMMNVSPPNITYANLTDPAGMLEPDGSRGPRYTDQLIWRAVTQGIDADGKPLQPPMPRWQPTDQQWHDLLAYLKMLK